MSMGIGRGRGWGSEAFERQEALEGKGDKGAFGGARGVCKARDGGKR